MTLYYLLCRLVRRTVTALQLRRQQHLLDFVNKEEVVLTSQAVMVRLSSEIVATGSSWRGSAQPRVLAKAIYCGATPPFTFWPSPFKFESATLQSTCATIFYAHKVLNVHAQHISSGKPVAVGTWHVFIR